MLYPVAPGDLEATRCGGSFDHFWRASSVLGKNLGIPFQPQPGSLCYEVNKALELVQGWHQRECLFLGCGDVTEPGCSASRLVHVG